MNTPASNSSEILAAATSHDSRLEGIRQLVDSAYAELSGIEDLELATPPANAVPVNTEGEVEDSARRERIAKAEQEVANAYEAETMPKPEPSQLEDLYLG